MLPLALIACEQPASDQQATIAAESNQEAAAPEDANHIYCAVDGAQWMTRECTAEFEQREDGVFVTVRNPDGGFHRLVVSADDYGVVAADGAEPAKVHALEKQGKTTFEISIGGDRYQLPGRIKGRLPDGS